jgi:hypothetical protein
MVFSTFFSTAEAPDPLVPLEATWRFPVAQAEEFDHLRNPGFNLIILFSLFLKRW